jgi:RimJ/RimL family protein N-acetyltransferase
MEQLLVRHLEEEDLPTRVEWLSHPSISGQMVVPLPASLARTRTWFSQSSGDDSRTDVVFVYRSDDPGKSPALCAMGGLTSIDRLSRHAELYILVGPDSRGLGIGTAATQWLCNHGFTEHSLNRVYLYTMGCNPGARRLYERLGFTREGVLRSHLRHRGHWEDRHIHGILHAEWQLQPWSCVDPPGFSISLPDRPVE